MLFSLHGLLRYVVLLAGAATLLTGLFGLATRRPYGLKMPRIAAIFSGSLLVECIVGSLILTTGRFGNAMIAHMFTTVAATAIAFMSSSRVRRTPRAERTFWPHVVGAAAALILVAVAVAAVGEPILG